MSINSKPTYRNSKSVVPDSDSDNQEALSSNPISSPPSPSSGEFSSDPAVLINPSISSHNSDQVNLDLVFPSTSAEFNLTQTHTTLPSSSSKSIHKEDHTITALPPSTNPVFTPPKLQPIANRTMTSNPNHLGVNALPIQGKRDSPRTFKGSYDKVEEFLKTMDKLFARYEVKLDDDKVDAILQYCSTKVQDFIRTSPSFTKPNWDKLKKHMMDYYDAERASHKYTPNDIWSFNKVWNLKSITNLTQWKKYYRDFFSKAGALLTRGEISEKDFNTYFWLGLPESICLIFEPKIQAQIVNYDASIPYTIEQICSVAENYFKRNKFTEMVFNPLKYQPEDDSDSDSDDSSSDSDSDSDYDAKKRRKLRKKKKAK